jgi:tryptophan synthase beta subunit
VLVGESVAHGSLPCTPCCSLQELCPTLPDGCKVVLNCSGRGDKDVNTVIKALGMQPHTV